MLQVGRLSSFCALPGVRESSGTNSPTSVLAGPDAGSGLGAGLAAAGVDVRAVEAHMQQLLRQWLRRGR